MRRSGASVPRQPGVTCDATLTSRVRASPERRPGQPCRNPCGTQAGRRDRRQASPALPPATISLRAGHHVTILEAAPDFGGLAGSFPSGRSPGRTLLPLHLPLGPPSAGARWTTLGLSAKLHWRRTRTAFYHNQRFYAFGTPFDLFRFSPVPWAQRCPVRSAHHALSLSSSMAVARPDPGEGLAPSRASERKPTTPSGTPCSKVKFGDYHDRISAAWIWHRIWRVAQSRRSLFERESFGYLGARYRDAGGPTRRLATRSAERGVARRRQVEPLVLRDGRVSEVRAGDSHSLRCRDLDSGASHA